MQLEVDMVKEYMWYSIKWHTLSWHQCLAFTHTEDTKVVKESKVLSQNAGKDTCISQTFTSSHLQTLAFSQKISLLHMYTSLNYTHPFKYIRMRTHTNTKTHHTNIHASTMCNQTFSPWEAKAMIFFSLFTLNVDTIFLQRYMYVQFI